MSKVTAIAVGTLIVGLGGCISHGSHGPDGVAYSTRDGAGSVGATAGGAGGAISGSAAGSRPQVEKEQRGNTPPGIDRDGHGPAAGAIVDPTGAATRGKPY